MDYFIVRDHTRFRCLSNVKIIEFRSLYKMMVLDLIILATNMCFISLSIVVRLDQLWFVNMDECDIVLWV